MHRLYTHQRETTLSARPPSGCSRTYPHLHRHRGVHPRQYSFPQSHHCYHNPILGTLSKHTFITTTCSKPFEQRSMLWSFFRFIEISNTQEPRLWTLSVFTLLLLRQNRSVTVPLPSRACLSKFLVQYWCELSMELSHPVDGPLFESLVV